MSNENRVKDIDSPVHDWYRFVLSFPPHLVREYIKKFSICKEDVVLPIVISITQGFTSILKAKS